jgi:hypothetical protein
MWLLFCFTKNVKNSQKRTSKGTWAADGSCKEQQRRIKLKIFHLSRALLASTIRGNMFFDGGLDYFSHKNL